MKHKAITAAALALLAAAPASAMTQQEAQQQQQQQINMIYNAGIQAYNNHDYNTAINRMNAVLPYMQNNKTPFMVIGDSFFHLGNASSAFQYLHRAYDLGSREFVTLSGIGTIHLEAKQYQDAYRWFNETTQHYPRNKAAWWKLGRACDEIGDAACMLNSMTHFIQLAPQERADAYKYQGLAYRAQGNEQGAFSSFKNGVGYFPDDPELNFFLGDAYYYVYGQIDPAITHLDKAIRLVPDYLDAHATLGTIFADLGDEGGAMQECDTLYQLDRNAEATQKVCKVAQKLRQDREMREMIDRQNQEEMDRQSQEQQEQMNQTTQQAFHDTDGMNQSLYDTNQNTFGMGM